MIILYGQYILAFGSQLTPGPLQCGKCGTATQFFMKRGMRFGHLYYVPLLPMSKAMEIIQCPKCKARFLFPFRDLAGATGRHTAIPPASFLSAPSHPPVFPPNPAPAASPKPAPALNAPSSSSEYLIRLGSGRLIPLSDGASLTAQQIPGSSGIASATIAVVERHPNDPALRGLRNCSEREWTARLPNGEFRTIAKDKVVRLAPGVVIDFGSSQAEVIAP